ncbi:EcsC family protein [Alkaliphilus crotonatoxidans]
MDKEWIKQFKKIDRQEKKMINKSEKKLFEAQIAPIKDKIQEKIPDKLQLALEAAFFKSFKLVFERGSTYIEKTYDKDKHRLEHELNNYGIDTGLRKKYIKNLDKQANSTKLINESISLLEGSLLGFLGIGLPDIPLFIAVIMKTIYEVALSYGYEYETDEERAFILLIICGAMGRGHGKKKLNNEIDLLGEKLNKQGQVEINLNDQMMAAANALSESMLLGKFIQGIPVIGVVGGVVNYSMIRKIGKYATLKYKKRYLLKKLEK